MPVFYNWEDSRPFRKKYASRLCEDCKAHGLTIAALARRLGYSPAYFHDISSGKKIPRFDLFNKIAAILHWPAIHLTTFSDFILNHCYIIDDYVFTYEGKQGIHHLFRNVRGNWTRTYTDAQLIGKIVEEVEA